LGYLHVVTCQALNLDTASRRVPSVPLTVVLELHGTASPCKARLLIRARFAFDDEARHASKPRGWPCMNATKTGFLIVMGAALGGCAGVRQPPYDPSSPVDLDGYKQQGRAVDRDSLKEGLLKEDGSKELVEKSRAVAIPAQILAGAGGALVGWPLGEAAGGSRDPHWVLAGVGGGVAAVGIALGFWADAIFEDAVKAHNEQVDGQPRPSARWRGNSFTYTW
jgi:hypothetical protein